MDAAQPAPGAQAPEAPSPTCFRHADRESYVRCSRCDRYACPDCRREAAVGYQCVECVKSGRQGVRQARTAFGGRITSRPYGTIALIVVNVAVYLAEVAGGRDFVNRFAMIGSGALWPYDPDTWDGFTPIPVGGVAHGEWYRLITGNFLHLQPTEPPLGVAHLLLNMYWLWMLGRVVEDRLGVLRMVGLYLLSALGCSALEYLLNPHGLSLGASGAVFGLVGGYWVLSRKQGYDPLGGSQLMVTFVIWMVLSAGFASWQGHLGGLLAGLGGGAALAYAPREQRGTVQAISLTAVLAVVAIVVVIATDQLNQLG
ncbi:rhomboid family intramembrane serine protease [Streptomyces sp. TLI_171]|uniref:rhomboid family intramembrane serine protease n=1 Tax=Streptomyces sp. TLI_171 TaxID=1938859 RepID=UPI000C182890|nr:rhomboid family intramembrane serine protease [Streptomyces sp. TLI_171]RKE18115.1 membrane associated rhomboid family serine protease [Streptomyces sp. TLI_171]